MQGVNCQADAIAQGVLAMLYKVKWDSCSFTVAGTAWRLEEQNPTVQGCVINFSVTSDGRVSPLCFRAGFQAVSPTWHFEFDYDLVQLATRRLLMVVGTFSRFCLKMKLKAFVLSLSEPTRKKTQFAKICLTCIAESRSSFYSVRIGDSGKIGGLLPNAE